MHERRRPLGPRVEGHGYMLWGYRCRFILLLPPPSSSTSSWKRSLSLPKARSLAVVYVATLLPACLLSSLSLSVLRFFPSFFFSSPSPYPPPPSPSVFRAGHAPFVVAPRARLHSSCSPSSRASSRGVVSSRGVREDASPRPCRAESHSSYAWGRSECGWKSTAGHQPPLPRPSPICIYIYIYV